MRDGLCECGCGERTTIAPVTDRKYGWVKGKPKRYVRYHRKSIPDSECYREEDRGYTTPCWIWQLRRIWNGYGVRRDPQAKRMVPAHRLFYEAKYGPIPEGLVIDHLCRERACVNPDHLEPVTPAENNRRGQGPTRKLTMAIATELREAFAVSDLGPLVFAKAHAERFGVHPNTIWCLLRGYTWQ